MHHTFHKHDTQHWNLFFFRYLTTCFEMLTAHVQLMSSEKVIRKLTYHVSAHVSGDTWRRSADTWRGRFGHKCNKIFTQYVRGIDFDTPKSRGHCPKNKVGYTPPTSLPFHRHRWDVGPKSVGPLGAGLLAPLITSYHFPSPLPTPGGLHSGKDGFSLIWKKVLPTDRSQWTYITKQSKYDEFIAD